MVAYYAAITNHIAQQENIPIEMVIRSSFGHNLPTVDVTGNTFRISLGLVPAYYATIMAKSLKELQRQLNILLGKNTTPKLTQSVIDMINQRIEEYNVIIEQNYPQSDKIIELDQEIQVQEEQIQSLNKKLHPSQRKVEIKKAEEEIQRLEDNKEIELTKEDKETKEVKNKKKEFRAAFVKANEQAKKKNKPERSLQKYAQGKITQYTLPTWNTSEQAWYKLLQLKGDATNKSILSQLTRKREYKYMLMGYVVMELQKPQPNLLSPIDRMLGHLHFVDAIQLKIPDQDWTEILKRKKWNQSPENDAIKADTKFWELIERTVDAIGGDTALYTNKNILDLYSKLEEANQDFIKHSAKRADLNLIKTEDFDSLSDGEDEATHTYYKKRTVDTGMKALKVANWVVRKYLKDSLDQTYYWADYKYMYYETEKIFDVASEKSAQLATYLTQTDLKKRADKNEIPCILFLTLTIAIRQEHQPLV